MNENIDVEELEIEVIVRDNTKIFREGPGNRTSEYYFFSSFLIPTHTEEFEREIDRATPAGCVDWTFYLSYRFPNYRYPSAGRYTQYLFVLNDIIYLLDIFPNAPYTQWSKPLAEVLKRRTSEIVKYRRMASQRSGCTQNMCSDHHDSVLHYWTDIDKKLSNLYARL